MKKSTFVIISILSAAVILFWFFRTYQYKPLTDTLIIGTTADFPPFSFIDLQGNITGFDIDIAKEVAKRLNLKPQIQDKPFALLLPQLEVGQIHIIAAGMTATPERAKRVSFTKPYLTGNNLIVISPAQKPKITSITDLKNKNVIVNSGYTADLYLSNFEDINLVRLETIADAFNALEQGNADAFVTAAKTLTPYLDKFDVKKDKFNTFTIQEADESSSIAIANHLPDEFKEKVQKALDEMERDGTLEKIKRTWNVL